MSEYQYYEFRAIDRPLTEHQMEELRALSTRADITPTSFVNTYNWGDFKGDPAKLMEKYFDAFVYVANWGTHEFMLRIPSRFLPACAAQFATSCDTVTWWESGDNTIISFRVEDEPGQWDEEGEGWLDSLISIRNDLMAGDLRALYLGWLRDIQGVEFDEGEAEPEVEPLPPPGLRALTTPLDSLVDFLGVDRDLISAAAANSPDLDSTQPSKEELARWICSLPEADKNEFLLELATQESPHFRRELLLRFQQSRAGSNSVSVQPQQRTVAELLAAAQARTATRVREEQEQARVERERKEREAAIARANYLDGLRRRQAQTWAEVESLIATKRPQGYDRAVGLLRDLGELSDKDGKSAEFQSRVRRLRESHSKKPSFLQRLAKTGLGT
jgi:hypothetical protein